MARTEKDVVSYFPHDAHASSGDTLSILQGRYGNNGYAFWFKLLEKLASTEGHYIDCRNNMRWQLLIAYLGVDEITTVEMLKLLVEIEAIDKELWQSKVIWCQNLVKNIADVYKNRRREIPRKPILNHSNPITTDDNAITTDSNTQSKVKESKVNKSKYMDVVFLADEEHKKLIEKFGESGTNERIESLSLYIKSKGNKYKDHYATILNWERMKKERGEDGKNRGSTSQLKERHSYTRPEDYGK